MSWAPAMKKMVMTSTIDVVIPVTRALCEVVWIRTPARTGNLKILSLACYRLLYPAA